MTRHPLLRLALRGHALDRLANRLLIAQELHRNDRLQVLVQLVHERNAGRQIQQHDRIIAELVQVLNDAAQTVAVRRNDDLLAGFHLRHDLLVPVGQRARNRQLQRLKHRELGRLRVARVARVLHDGIVVGMRRVHRRRWRVEAAPPDLHLLLAVFGGSFGFVEASQAAVVALIQAPCLVHRDARLAGLAEDRLQRVLGACQQRRVGNVELEAGVLDGLAGGQRLGFACTVLGEVVSINMNCICKSCYPIVDITMSAIV